MKYYFPIHLDGGNRGCEAIARSTSKMIKENINTLTLKICKKLYLILNEKNQLVPCERPQ